MFGNEENLKDTRQNPLKDKLSANVPYKADHVLLDSYPKLGKLITALYMVTDILDKNEPIRLKLRTLGLEILSDTNSLSRTDLKNKVHSILSFLDISISINLIPEMNFNILKKEFTELSYLIDRTQEINQIKHTWLEEFLLETPSLPYGENVKELNAKQNLENKINIYTSIDHENSSFAVKKQRREDILKAIQNNGGGATIAEVRSKGSGSILICGEKTLQRELISMVKDNILTKTGEKRWSKYFLKDIS